MDPKFRKFKQQESKSHEKLLKVILSLYKPYIRKNRRKSEDKDGLSQDEGSDEEIEEVLIQKNKDYASFKTKVDDETLERQKRAEQAEKVLGEDYPHLATMFINKEITLAQLKQNYYSLSKKIDYVCYDNLKNMLGISQTQSTHQRIRECYRNSRHEEPSQHKRPQSAS